MLNFVLLLNFCIKTGCRNTISNKEETIITSIIQIIEQEYHSNIDKFSQGIIIAQLESLLNFSDRFYNRQFITRKISNPKISNNFEEILTAYFNTDSRQEKGLPTVKSIAETLNTSTNYLSGVLKTLTGKNTQQHIHDKLFSFLPLQVSLKQKLLTSTLNY